jgi:hypothetical protein
LSAGTHETLVLDAAAFGQPEPLTLRRLGGDTFVVHGDPPGGMPIAVDGSLLYIGPFAMPRNH